MKQQSTSFGFTSSCWVHERVIFDLVVIWRLLPQRVVLVHRYPGDSVALLTHNGRKWRLLAGSGERYRDAFTTQRCHYTTHIPTVSHGVQHVSVELGQS
jgi:hypothetical protein